MLNGPSSLSANSLNRWTTPGVHLAPNTNYFVLVDSLGGFSNGVFHTTSDNEDPESSAGWSILNTARVRQRASTGSWTIGDVAYLMRLDDSARASFATKTPTTPKVDSDPDSPTTLTVNWRRPFAPVNVPISRYDVRYSTDGSTWYNWTQTGMGTSETITGLTRGTAYQVQVRAVHTPPGGSDNISAWSASGFGTPGGPASVFVVGNTSKANEFTDNANLDDHEVFQGFRTGSHSEDYVVTGGIVNTSGVGVGDDTSCVDPAG